MVTIEEERVERTARYLKRVAGVKASRDAAAIDTARLMRFLTGAYSFSYIRLDGGRRLLFSAIGEARPSAVARHAEILAEATGVSAVYLVDDLTKTGFDKLVAAGASFVSPGRHVHIPDVAVHFGERFARVGDDTMTEAPAGKLGPTAQAMVIRRILGLDDGRVPSMGLASALRVRSMTALNAAREIEAAGLAERGRHGHVGSMDFAASGRRLFDLALPLLHSPVVLRQHYGGVGTVTRGRVGGESALARRTLLADPSVPVRATSRSERRGFVLRTQLLPCREAEADLTVEVWRYDPDATAWQDELVDPVSLHLQFRDHPDERLAIAAHELLEAALPVT